MSKDTSREAYHEAQTFAARHRLLILAAMANRRDQPMAAEEIADSIGFPHQGGHVAVNRRMSELLADKLIVETNHRHTNRSNRKAVQYLLAS